MKKPVILCVDDEAIVLKSLATQLGRKFGEDFNIEFAESGEEALDIISELQEDEEIIPLIISDQLMPGIKGNELLKKVHQLSEKTLKILLTGQADAAAVGDIVNNAGLYRYIAKPWETDDLLLTVQEAVKSFFQDRKLEEQNKLLTEYNLELEKKVEERTSEIQKAHRNITDSINYAKLIQEAIFPKIELLDNHFTDHFIFFRPRDIVSGDFYWMDKAENKIIITAADCTGHGVPGAFMSLLGISFLNEIVAKTKNLCAGEVLDFMRQKIKTTLNQSGKENEQRDGMDMALCIIDTETQQLEYAGAYNPLYIIRDHHKLNNKEKFSTYNLLYNNGNALIEIKANHQPIAIHFHEQPFATHKIDLLKGDKLYLFSDGFADQFNGENGKKFMTKNFKKLLLEIGGESMKEQSETLCKRLNDWQKGCEQIDDILVVGIEI